MPHSPPPKNGQIGKVPPGLHPLVIAKAQEGLKSEAISEWLWREHQLQVAARTVRQLVRRHRTELADVAKGAVREEIRKRLIPALRRAARGGIKANEIEKRVSRQANEARAANRTKLAASLDALTLKAIDRQVKVADLLMHYAGLDQPDAPTKQSAQERRQALLKRLEELTSKPGAVAEQEGEPQVN
jgi:hypothetical protein